MYARFLLVVICLAVTLSACSSYRPAGSAFHKVLTQPYTLDSGDRLRVVVFDQADLSNDYTVDQAGYLSMPLIGAVAARGATTGEVELSIARQLANGFIRTPDVTVEVAQYRPFFILGEVNSSGQYIYVAGMTVQNAIAVAGGFTARASQRYVDITRNVNGKIITGRVRLTDPVRPGDTIYVKERLL
ncbi:MAG: polysaccharide export protein [Cohaesibacteraceae bacterium]|nr:polysaccharide export protein [Cohaesibacteraceae bacterium]MBL4875532.1 polysaccharide export protein [Cohaesibacteraceae bacterium]